MTFKSLLAAASVAALSAGAAQALEIDAAYDPGGFNLADADADLVTTPLLLPEELDFTPGPTGELALAISTNGTIPPGQNVFVRLVLTGASFSSTLNGNEVTAGVTGAVVDAGGASGSTQVTYLVTTDAIATPAPGVYSTSGTNTDYIQLELPVRATGCGVTIALTVFATENPGQPAENGTVIEGGSTSAETYASCVDAFAAGLLSDESTTPSYLDPSATVPFSRFIDDGAGPDGAAFGGAYADTDLEYGRLCVYDASINTSANKTLTGTNVVPGDVEGFSTVVVLGSSTTGVTSFLADPNPYGDQLFDAFAGVGGTLATTLSDSLGAVSTSESGDLRILLDITNPIVAPEPQTVDIASSVLLLDTTWFEPTDDFLFTSCEDLKYGGQVFGEYDWVGDKQAATNNVFRVTGLPDEDVLTYIILLNTTGGALDGIYEAEIPESWISAGGEAIITKARLSSMLEDAGLTNGIFGRADVTFVFATSTDNDLDVDRLLASPASQAVAPYGDGSNMLSGGGTIVSPEDPDLVNGPNDDDGAITGQDDH